MKKLQKSFVLFLLQFATLVHSQRTKDKMYEDLQGTACFRRLNSTHSTGCSSSYSGSVGVLHLINTVEDVNFLLNDPPRPPYTPIIPPALFTRDTVMKLKEKGTDVINGIVVINDRSNLKTFSHDSRCPNQFGGLISKQTCDINNPDTAWNPYGTGLMLENYDFPIYYVSDAKEVQDLIDCFKKFNQADLENQNSRPLCSIEIKSLMSAAGSSETCIRRSNTMQNLAAVKYCDPLQGKNIYGTLFERTEVEEPVVDPNEKFILVTTRTDTTSMFDETYSGAMDSLVPFATVLATAQFLNAILPNKTDTTKFNVIFMFFNGESFDYIGSQRFVYDLQNQFFPDRITRRNLITLDNIELMIDIGTLDDFSSITAYSVKSFDLLQKTVGLLNSYSTEFQFNINVTDVQQDSLPPFSSHSFLRENLSFPAFILTSQPKNRYFHSIFDDAVNVNFTYLNQTDKNFMELETLSGSNPPPDDNIQYKIRNFATLLGSAIYELITGEKYSSKKVVNVGLVDEFLYCFLSSSNCTMFRVVADHYPINLGDHVPMRYIGVNTGFDATLWTYRIIGFLLGKNTDRKKEDCAHQSWFNGVDFKGECKLTTHFISLAQSPAFLDENYDWKSNKYSTWTESTWSEISARIFLQPSKSHEALTFAVGLIVLIISFVLVYLINSRSDVLFADSASTTPIAPPANC